MNRRTTVGAAAAVLGLFVFATDGSSAQASKNRPVVAGCPSISAKFHSCALAKARSFNPPRTPDGEPDLTWLWDAPAIRRGPTSRCRRRVTKETATRSGSCLAGTDLISDRGFRNELNERLRREGNVLHYQATVKDPDVLIRPWVMNHPRVQRLNPNPHAMLEELLPCVERDRELTVTRERG